MPGEPLKVTVDGQVATLLELTTTLPDADVSYYQRSAPRLRDHDREADVVGLHCQPDTAALLVPAPWLAGTMGWRSVITMKPVNPVPHP